MKRILYLLGTGLILSGCSSQEIEFEDFHFTGVYFSHQTPVRTLMLGDEVLGDNSIDLEHAFSIGVAMGGVYENRQDRIVGIEYAPELAQNLMTAGGQPLELLPADYYEAEFDEIIIPAGSLHGKTRIQLKDAFFEDPRSSGLYYVIPVRITGTSLDSILGGTALEYVESPDRRIADHWKVPPKDYTLFGIKYVNAIHGMYLLRGKRIELSPGGDTTYYSARFLTDNDMIKLTTGSLTESVMTTVGGTNQGGIYAMALQFDKETKRVTVSSLDSASVLVEGSGSLYSRHDEQAESYNGDKHRTIYLDYTYQDNGTTYRALDSLVFVDTDVTFESFRASVNQN